MADDRDPRDSDDDSQRRRVTIIAAIAVALLLAAMIWLVLLFVERQNLEKCILSGRRNCVPIEQPDRNGALPAPKFGTFAQS